MEDNSLHTLLYLRKVSNDYIRDYYYRNVDLWYKWKDKLIFAQASEVKRICNSQINKYRVRKDRALKILEERKIWY